MSVVEPGGATLITGATGFLGREILVRLAARSRRPIYALVRAGDDAAAERRLAAALRERGGPERRVGRVIAVAADIEAPGLGLAPRRYERLRAAVTDIVHAAASVSFTLPVPEARAVNVEGTRRLVDLAEECHAGAGLRRFTHVSTAYVAGDHDGRFGEEDLEVGQEFHNSYEQTKFEAERLVRARRQRLPIQILRPSIVVGEQRSGWTGSFNVLYAPLGLYARGALPAIPARLSAPVDVVPVDFVADAVMELFRGPAEDNRTYHLVAGQEATTVGELIDLAARTLGRPRPLALPPAIFARLARPLLGGLRREAARRVLDRAEVFFPYFSGRVSYANERTLRRLRTAGIEPPPVESYFERLVDYAQRARWGRRTLPLGA
jgi:thioester reductase-like protein